MDQVQIGFVDIGRKKYINTLVLNPEKSKNVVLLHGYGAGLGFFWKNYPAFLGTDYRLYSLDWLGMALSSRVRLPRAKGLTEPQMVQETESFFIDALEQWREKVGLEKMVLCGHSLGGYLSTAYALKYPERVEKLVLISPAGVPPRPEQLPRGRSMMGRLITNLVVNNISPMSLIRTAGPWGSSLLKNYTSRRFSHLPPEELMLFHNYLYHISSQRGSGEYALSRLLLPGAFAREPLHNKFARLQMPTTLIYGSHDWMNYEHAVNAGHLFKTKCVVAVVYDAGHHLYLDNPSAFNKVFLSQLKSGPIETIEDVVYPFVS
ncbi:alpha/beta-hydrolase [Gorgonomyces haynaldii]|nr:alpha/beta-hydrolase [Gorgonomyces haynaldii]